jgi:tetratricopeptide (TPR) repeat protein
MKAILLVFVLFSAVAVAADDLEKTQKKELEAQVKKNTAEAESLEKTGQLAEARTRYAESQALIEMKNVTDAIKRLDDEIHKRMKDSLSASRKLYELHEYKETAAALEESIKLQAYQSVIAYDLALCYYQLGERNKAVEYLRKAKAGTGDPKQKLKLAQLLTFFTTGENGLPLNDTDKDRVGRVNQLSESIGVEASLEDAGGEEDPLSEGEAPAAPLATPVSVKTNVQASTHSNVTASRRSSLCNALGELKGTLASSPSATFNLANCAETNARA